MRTAHRWLGIAGFTLSMAAVPSAGADQVTITGALSHDPLSDPDVLGLDGASFEFVSGVAPDDVPYSSGTQGGPNAFDYAFYSTVGSFTLTGSAGGDADGTYAAIGAAGFRSPVDPGFDWIEIAGYPNTLAPNARVSAQVFFANNAVIPGNPLGFLAFDNAQATVSGDLVISDGNPHGGISVSYDMTSPAVIGTLPEAGELALGATAMLALAAFRRRRS